MGTRSTTKFIDETGTCLCAMYRQMDGYPSCHGKELAEFLAGIRRTGGKGPVGTANGIQCLAAQAVAHFKTEPGGIYLVPAYQEEEWNYVVMDWATVPRRSDWLLRVRQEDNDLDYFCGTPQEFLDMLEKDDE